MIRIQKPLCPQLTFRLVHDLSPDAYDDVGDIDSDTYNTNSITDYPLKRTNGLSPKETFLLQNNLSNIISIDSNKKNYNKTNGAVNVKHKNEINQKYHCYEKSSSTADSKFEKESFQGDKPNSSNNFKVPRRPRKLPEIPKHQNKVVQVNTTPTPSDVERSLADELHEALRIPEEDNDVFSPESVHSDSDDLHGESFLRRLHFHLNSVSKNTKAYSNTDNIYAVEDSSPDIRQSTSSSNSSVKRRKRSDSDSGSSIGGRSQTTSHHPSVNYNDLVVTHRGMHRFIPRHSDEITIEIGDALHVLREGDDLWCDGINLRTGQTGIFPSMYATDMNFLEEEEDGEDGCAKFNLRFLGSIEVNYHKGDEVICQAINRVALMARENRSSKPPPQCALDISQYGIRMIDKSKTGHESEENYTNFFALKNISFCGYHPRNERYFGFITKHPKEYRFACHVFLGEKSTKSVSEALRRSFQRFYTEYLAFTHPTEDIYME